MPPVLWLRANRRALLGAAAPALLAALVGAWLGQILGPNSVPAVVGGTAWIWAGWIVALTATVVLAFLLWQATRPRLAYADGSLLVYLRAGKPIAVPIDVVECFLLGQGATLLEDGRFPSRTVTLLVRLAEKRTEWAHLEVHRLLGAWCGGQITIRGTWCEPLTLDVVNQLNERLAATQHEWAKSA